MLLRRFVAAVVPVVAAVTACGSSAGTSGRSNVTTTVRATTTEHGLGSVAHAMVVANAIKAARIGCVDPTMETVPDAGTALNPFTEQVTCLIGDDNIVISVFRDHDAMTRLGLPYMRQARCYMESHESPNTTFPPNMTYAAGDNWIVYPEKKSTAVKVAAAVGASVRTDAC